jgi:hypothetical protein
MQVSSLTRSTALALLLVGLACARNNSSDTEVEGDARMSERADKASESWRGNERRYGNDASYTGPERRLATR